MHTTTSSHETYSVCFAILPMHRRRLQTYNRVSSQFPTMIILAILLNLMYISRHPCQSSTPSLKSPISSSLRCQTYKKSFILLTMWACTHHALCHPPQSDVHFQASLVLPPHFHWNPPDPPHLRSQNTKSITCWNSSLPLFGLLSNSFLLTDACSDTHQVLTSCERNPSVTSLSSKKNWHHWDFSCTRKSWRRREWAPPLA